MNAENAAIVFALVAALRARIPQVDGWVVLPVALAATALVTFAMSKGEPPVTLVKEGLLTWILAIGTPAALSRLLKSTQTLPTK